MKTVKTLLIGMMMLISSAMMAQPMSYNAMRNNARFLTDRMAYTLGITNLNLLEDIYRINFDYIYGLNTYLDDIALGYRYEDYLDLCEERDFALRMLLGDVIWNRLIGYDYFYRPITFHNHRWSFCIYEYDRNIHHFYYSVPRHYEVYRGGHFFGGMRPNRGIGDRGPGMASWGPRTPRRDGGNMNHGGGRPGDRDGYHGGNNGRPGGYNGSYSNQGRPGNNGGYANQGRPDNNGGYGNQDRPNSGSRSGGDVTRGRDTNRSSNSSYSGSYDPTSNRSQSNINSSSRSSSRATSYENASRSSSYGSSSGYRSSSSSSSTPSRSSSYGSSSSSSGGSYSSSRGGSSSSGSSSRGGGGSVGGHSGRR